MEFGGSNPQYFGRYQYAINNPIKYVDPDGREHTTVRETWLRQTGRTKQSSSAAGSSGENLTGVTLNLGTKPKYSGMVMVKDGPRDPAQDLADATALATVGIATCALGGCEAVAINTVRAWKTASATTKTVQGALSAASLKASVELQISMSRTSPVVAALTAELSFGFAEGLHRGSNLVLSAPIYGSPAQEIGYAVGWIFGAAFNSPAAELH